jgi:hypothetical protein
LLSAEPILSGSTAENMKAIGYSGLDGHGGAFKISVRRVANKSDALVDTLVDTRGNI